MLWEWDPYNTLDEDRTKAFFLVFFSFFFSSTSFNLSLRLRTITTTSDPITPTTTPDLPGGELEVHESPAARSSTTTFPVAGNIAEGDSGEVEGVMTGAGIMADRELGNVGGVMAEMVSAQDHSVRDSAEVAAPAVLISVRRGALSLQHSLSLVASLLLPRTVFWYVYPILIAFSFFSPLLVVRLNLTAGRILGWVQAKLSLLYQSIPEAQAQPPVAEIV